MKFQLLIGTALCLAVASAQCQDANEVQELKKQLQELQKRIEQLERQQQQKEQPPPPAAPPAQTPETASLTNRWSPEQPMRIGSAQNYINLSFDALFAAGWSSAEDVEALEPGAHDPKQRGFTAQDLETVFDGKVDPYF